MAIAKNWSQDELQVLKDLYPEFGYDGVKDLIIGRTRTAITLKASRMGLVFLNNPRQPKYTEHEYKTKLLIKNITLLGTYNNLVKPTLHKCNTCGLEWRARPQSVLHSQYSGCPECSNKARFTDNSTMEAVLAEKGLTAVSDYIGALKPLTVRHTCGYTYTTVYSYIQQGSGCPKCNRNNWTVAEPGYFYVLSMILGNGDYCYKIGVTKHKDISNRIKSIICELKEDIIKITPEVIVQGPAPIIKALEMKLLAQAITEHKTFSSYKKFAGYTELVDESFLPSILGVLEKEPEIELFFSRI